MLSFCELLKTDEMPDERNQIISVRVQRAKGAMHLNIQEPLLRRTFLSCDPVAQYYSTLLRYLENLKYKYTRDVSRVLLDTDITICLMIVHRLLHNSSLTQAYNKKACFFTITA